MKKSTSKAASDKPINRFGFLSKLLFSLLLWLLAALFLLSAAASLLALDYDYYRGGSPDAHINHLLHSFLRETTKRDLTELASLKIAAISDDSYQSEYTTYRIEFLEDRYRPEHSNILYRITDGTGNVLAENFSGEVPNYLSHTQSGIIEGSSKESPAEHTVDAYIRSDLSAKDTVYYLKETCIFIFEQRYLAIIIAAVTLLLCAIVLCLILSIAGKHKGEVGVRTCFLHKIPLELLTGYAFLVVGLWVVTADVLYYTPFFYDLPLFILLTVGVYSILFFSTLYLFTTLAVRLKTRTFIKSTLIYMLCCAIFRFFKRMIDAIRPLLGDKSAFFKCAAIILGGILCDFFFFVAILNSDGRDFAAFFAFSIWLTKTIYLAYLLFRNATNLRILILGSARISEGDLESKIPYSTLGSEYKELAVNLNHVSDGMQSALQKQLKSERMKTELITNVSHDIKTPLTNIINYVDLLKNEHTDSEKSKEYLQVLDKQSSRLKKLIEDLIETSKAASGNISTNPLSTNLGILLTQSVGEYKDRLEASGLEVLVTLPQADLYAYCDPRLTWRVFDNLLSNVGKYSMAGTRVYISAEETEKAAQIIFKNISKDQLNVSPDELTERFVRGDRARNTEGSGLGLSIAKSLTELQQGSLEIAVDGDMFKATVRLPKE